MAVNQCIIVERESTGRRPNSEFRSWPPTLPLLQNGGPNGYFGGESSSKVRVADDTGVIRKQAHLRSRHHIFPRCRSTSKESPKPEAEPRPAICNSVMRTQCALLICRIPAKARSSRI